MEPESTPVVPAHRVLEVAQQLTDGAARLHEELQELPPDRRQAVLDAVVGQVGDIVRAWSQLVQAVVSVESPPPAATRPDRPVAAPDGLTADRDAPLHAPLHTPLRPPADEPAHEPRDTPADEPRDTSPDALPATGTVPAPHSARGPFSAAPRQWRRFERTAPEPATAREPVSVASAVTGEVQEPPPSRTRAGDGAAPNVRDELTGVLNRQSGFAAIEGEISRSRRDGVHLVLGYLNVDGMHEVNDLRGPHGGDELLRKVAAALRATLRSYDVIMRLAGDEFLFSLPGADLTTAEKRIKEFGIILGEEAPGASVSVGFAELQPEDTVEDMVARADDALVQARRRRARRRLR